MPRPNKSDERRKELLPQVAEAFSELGYRRATTAEIAARCDVQENILYRLWQDKKAMFLAAIEYLFFRRMELWESNVTGDPHDADRAARLIEFTGDNLGEQGLYRIIFAAMSETNDPDVKQALQRLYRRYHSRIEQEIREYREGSGAQALVNDTDLAWTLIALVTFMNTALDLQLMGSRKRKQLFTTLANALLKSE